MWKIVFLYREFVGVGKLPSAKVGQSWTNLQAGTFGFYPTNKQAKKQTTKQTNKQTKQTNLYVMKIKHAMKIHFSHSILRKHSSLSHFLPKDILWLTIDAPFVFQLLWVFIVFEYLNFLWSWYIIDYIIDYLQFADVLSKFSGSKIILLLLFFILIFFTVFLWIFFGFALVLVAGPSLER